MDLLKEKEADGPREEALARMLKLSQKMVSNSSVKEKVDDQLVRAASFS